MTISFNFILFAPQNLANFMINATAYIPQEQAVDILYFLNRIKLVQEIRRVLADIQI